MQIIIQTDKMDMEKHLDVLEEIKIKEPFLAEMVEDYISFLKAISRQRESTTKKFYIVLKQPTLEDKLRAHFEEMGNVFVKCQESEIQEMLKRFFRKASGIRKETKWV